jgi:signal transduction histidine kinase
VNRASRALQQLDPRVLDSIVALALSVAALAIMAGRSTDSSFRADDALGVVLALGQTVPLAVRRVSPLGALTAISIALVAHSALGFQVIQAGTFGSLVSVYGAASLCDRRGGLLALGITAAAIVGFYATNREDWGTGDILAVSATWAMAWLLGQFVRIRGQQAEAAGARVVSLELEQEARAREAVADERARMARELHDIVGHALNIMVIQASGAQRVLDERPDAARTAVASIESTGRAALLDMERMLGVLRSPSSEGDPEPQPGLSQLPALAAQVSEAGIPVEVVIKDDNAAEIPASVDLSAYRIIQEALTNCLKHSYATHAIVTVAYGAQEVEVEILDNGRGVKSGAISGGRGHVGMQERVALFGGELHFGVAPGGSGYLVRAKLPFKVSPS